MAVPTGTVQTFTTIGIREDLIDAINLLEAYDTPVYTKIGNDKCVNRTPEWMAHTAPSPDTANYRIEGDDATNTSAAQPTRYKNHVQLMDKPYQVTTTQLVVDRAGMKELVRQRLLLGKGLKTDIESFITGNNASVAGAAGTAGRMAGMEAWINSNTDGGVGYAAGGYNTGTGLVAAATDGTQRAFTEAQLKSVVRQAWTAGGGQLDFVLGPQQKQNFAAFTGRATQFQNLTPGQKATITAGADVYVSDFGSHTAYPDRFSRNRTCLVLNWDLWNKAILQPIQTKELAINGHSYREMIYTELTLKCYNPLGNGKVADLT